MTAVRGDAGLFVPERERERSRVPLPAVAGRMSAGEWGAVAGLWLALALSAAPTLSEAARRAGVGVVYRDFLFLQTADWLGWMALLWPFFRLLDATPVVPPRRARNAALRGALLVGVAAAHGLLAHPMIRVGQRAFGVTDVVWRLGAMSPAGMFGDDLMNATVALVAYALVRRRHRRRLELTRAADLERSLLRARLHALDLELRPHFLFNTLNAIVALVKPEPEVAERMLVTLGDLLRATLGRMGGEIALREELDHLDLYLDIQRLRFGDRLEVAVEVDAEVLDARVPAMLLQPLVENALTHGLAPKCAPGRVAVSALRRGGELVLRVADDGVGLPAGPPRERTGVGNTRERLRVLYGDAAAFALRPRASGGAEAVVRLPFDASERRGPGGADA